LGYSEPSQKKDLYSALLIGYYELTLKELGRTQSRSDEGDEPLGGFIEDVYSNYKGMMISLVVLERH